MSAAAPVGLLGAPQLFTGCFADGADQIASGRRGPLDNSLPKGEASQKQAAFAPAKDIAGMPVLAVDNGDTRGIRSDGTAPVFKFDNGSHDQ